MQVLSRRLGVGLAGLAAAAALTVAMAGQADAATSTVLLHTQTTIPKLLTETPSGLVTMEQAPLAAIRASLGQDGHGLGLCHLHQRVVDRPRQEAALPHRPRRSGLSRRYRGDLRPRGHQAAVEARGQRRLPAAPERARRRGQLVEQLGRADAVFHRQARPEVAHASRVSRSRLRAAAGRPARPAVHAARPGDLMTVTHAIRNIRGTLATRVKRKRGAFPSRSRTARSRAYAARPLRRAALRSRVSSRASVFRD